MCSLAVLIRVVRLCVGSFHCLVLSYHVDTIMLIDTFTTIHNFHQTTTVDRDHVTIHVPSREGSHHVFTVGGPLKGTIVQRGLRYLVRKGGWGFWSPYKGPSSAFQRAFFVHGNHRYVTRGRFCSELRVSHTGIGYLNCSGGIADMAPSIVAVDMSRRHTAKTGADSNGRGGELLHGCTRL